MVQFPVGSSDCSLHHCVYTDLGDYLASSPVVTIALFTGEVDVELTAYLHLGPKLSVHRIMPYFTHYVSFGLQIKGNKRFLIINQYKIID